MKLHLNKKGLRVLGIAESFQKGEGTSSILAGVVMRGDFQIDGFGIATISVGGMDGTEGVMDLFDSLKREDINMIFLNGCIISWFNIIDINEIFENLKLPIICITYEESEGLEKYLKEYFEDWKERVEMYNKLGNRIPIKLNTGHEVLVRFLGIEEEKEAKTILDRFTIQGSIPEPLRVARILARAILKHKISSKE